MLVLGRAFHGLILMDEVTARFDDNNEMMVVFRCQHIFDAMKYIRGARSMVLPLKLRTWPYKIMAVTVSSIISFKARSCSVEFMGKSKLRNVLISWSKLHKLCDSLAENVPRSPPGPDKYHGGLSCSP